MHARTPILIFGLGLTVLISSACSVQVTRTKPPAPTDRIVVPRRLQIAITSDPQRPYEIRQIDRKFDRDELLAFLANHFADPAAAERDAILIIPETKAAVERLSAPIDGFAKTRGIRTISIAAPLNALDSVLDRSGIGVPIGQRPAG